MKKDEITPLYIAAENGFEQIAQILLEKGKANVNLPRKVSFLFSFSLSYFLFLFFFFSFSFSLSHFFSFDKNERMEKLLFILLLKMGMNKLFKFYWKKEEKQMLIFQKRFFCLKLFKLLISCFLLSFSFSHSHYFIYQKKNGISPLCIAVENGHGKIVQILLEKGANVNSQRKVLFLSLSFLSFVDFFFFFEYSIFFS